jgi:hypothetical protein
MSGHSSMDDDRIPNVLVNRSQELRPHIEIVRIISAVAAGVLTKCAEPFIPETWGPWGHRVMLAVLLATMLYACGALMRLCYLWTRERTRRRRLNAELRDAVQSVLGIIADTVDPNNPRCAGSLLTLLVDNGVIDTRIRHQCDIHLGTLQTVIAWLVADVEQRRTDALDALNRLIEIHHDYARLCCGVAAVGNAVEESRVHRAWDDVREHANFISDRLCEHKRVVTLRHGETPAPAYLCRIPRLREDG